MIILGCFGGTPIYGNTHVRFVAQQPSMRPCDFIWFTALVSMKPFTSDRRNPRGVPKRKKRHPANKVLPGSICCFFKYVRIKVDRFTPHKSKIQGIHFGCCFFFLWINSFALEQSGLIHDSMTFFHCFLEGRLTFPVPIASMHGIFAYIYHKYIYIYKSTKCR